MGVMSSYLCRLLRSLACTPAFRYKHTHTFAKKEKRKHKHDLIKYVHFVLINKSLAFYASCTRFRVRCDLVMKGILMITVCCSHPVDACAKATKCPGSIHNVVLDMDSSKGYGFAAFSQRSPINVHGGLA